MKSLKSLFFVVILCSCQYTGNVQNQYKNMDIINYGDHTAYEFSNVNSDKLVIL
jgi:hypothetical protein